MDSSGEIVFSRTGVMRWSPGVFAIKAVFTLGAPGHARTREFIEFTVRYAPSKREIRPAVGPDWKPAPLVSCAHAHLIVLVPADSVGAGTFEETVTLACRDCGDVRHVKRLGEFPVVQKGKPRSWDSGGYSSR